MKKAELSINMIIVAVISIVILVIVIFLVVTHLGGVNDATKCPGKGGDLHECIVCTDVVYDDGEQ